MGTPREPDPAALIAGITYTDREVLDAALEMLTGAFGPVEFSSPEFVFDMTDYYVPEMGAVLFKQFFCFRDPLLPGDLPAVKLSTNAVELRLAGHDDGEVRRRVNIDPGYVTLSKLVLASTKDYSHRVYIGRGVFAEVTLRYVRGEFLPIDTTYPDYRTPLALEFLTAARDHVKRNRPSWTRESASNN